MYLERKMARVADLSGNSPVGSLAEDAGERESLMVSPIDAQVVAYTGTAAASLPFSNLYQRIRICPSSDCFYKVGVNAVATVNDNKLNAGVVEYVKVKPGWVISAIQASAGGNLHIARAVS
jgi:hypothetical protein